MTAVRSLHPLVLALLVTGAVSGACSNTVDDSQNILPGGEDLSVPDTVMGTDTGVDGATGSSVCGDCFEVGTWYRFTSLTVESLDRGDHPLLFILNALWEADIARAELNVLFEVIEADDEHVVVNAMNAARLGQDDGTYCLLPETLFVFDLARDDCELSQSEPAQLNILAGTQDFPKNCALDLPLPNAIPVQDVLLTASMSADCQRLTSGHVPEAALSRDDLGMICTCTTTPDQYAESCGEFVADYEDDDGRCRGCNDNYINLEAFMLQFQDLEFLCQTADGGDAVCLEAGFEAERIDFTPPTCDEVAE